LNIYSFFNWSLPRSDVASNLPFVALHLWNIYESNTTTNTSFWNYFNYSIIKFIIMTSSIFIWNISHDCNSFTIHIKSSDDFAQHLFCSYHCVLFKINYFYLLLYCSYIIPYWKLSINKWWTYTKHDYCSFISCTRILFIINRLLQSL
jgi:hypothetical protein